jgi:hypothetical protein
MAGSRQSDFRTADGSPAFLAVCGILTSVVLFFSGLYVAHCSAGSYYGGLDSAAWNGFAQFFDECALCAGWCLVALALFAGPFLLGLGWIIHGLNRLNQRGSESGHFGQCPTCGGTLAGFYPKCPHCASDVFWAGDAPMRTAREAAEEERHKEQWAAERREEYQRLAAQRERLAVEARLQWQGRKRATLAGIVAGVGWLARITDGFLHRLARYRPGGEARPGFSSARLRAGKVESALRGWLEQLERGQEGPPANEQQREPPPGPRTPEPPPPP